VALIGEALAIVALVAGAAGCSSTGGSESASQQPRTR